MDKIEHRHSTGMNLIRLAMAVSLASAPLVPAAPAYAAPINAIGSGTTTVAYSGNLASYTVVASGLYDIVAYGADGGTSGFGGPGGYGAVVSGEFNLMAGEQLSILVGGIGQNGNDSYDEYAGGGGGGGGSFVISSVSDPLIVAGGGGGGSGASAGSCNCWAVAAGNGSIGTSGTGIGAGTAGTGGAGDSNGNLDGSGIFGGGGGGGYYGSGGAGGFAGGLGGSSFISGGSAGAGGGGLYGGYFAGGGGAGGFGGGGGGGGWEPTGGGGGGYSGGAGTMYLNGFGGGGGSFLAPNAVDPVQQTGGNLLDLGGNGEVTFRLLATIQVSAPEPGTFALMVAGLLGICLVTRRRTR